MGYLDDHIGEMIDTLFDGAEDPLTILSILEDAVARHQPAVKVTHSVITIDWPLADDLVRPAIEKYVRAETSPHRLRADGTVNLEVRCSTDVDMNENPDNPAQQWTEEWVHFHVLLDGVEIATGKTQLDHSCEFEDIDITITGQEAT